MSVLNDLARIGESIWLDNINRKLLETGELKKMISEGLLGMTSNPTIFDKAISGSPDYDARIRKSAGKDTFTIYDELTVKDVREALDHFKVVYEDSKGRDGFVSLEVDPRLADDTAATIKEARRLWNEVNRPNLMLKVPATTAGFPAIRTLIGEGKNVNATLIFSLGQYVEAAQAFIAGLTDHFNEGGDISHVASVASVFVSRIDSAIDKLIDKRDDAELKKIRGRAAVANSKQIYEKSREIFAGTKWEALASRGARAQRVLWASTGTKDPAYSDIKYVEELVGRNVVNTIPDNTYAALLDHGKVQITLADFAAAHRVISDLKQHNIDVDQVCAELLTDGVKAFEKSFTALLAAIESKAANTVCPVCGAGKDQFEPTE